MLKDPEFIAEVAKLKIDIGSMTGEELTQLVRDLVGVSPEVASAPSSRSSRKAPTPRKSRSTRRSEINMKVAEAIASACVAEGVQLAAGLAGTHISHVLDAISKREEISLMYARQERVALDIADGFARACGTPAVVFTDSGPAAANLMGGLVNSWGDSTPVLFFAGHVDLGTPASRDTKQIPFLDLFGPVSKWSAHDRGSPRT